MVRLIGEGGAGTVYEARHLALGNPVAIKVLFSHFARMRQIRERFVEEAQIQAQLRHPNLVGVFDIIDEGRLVAMVMEYVDGQSLDEYIDSHSPVDLSEGLSLALGMLSGLGFAHKEGIIHRDIKPENILLTEIEGQWVPKISDFGIAKVLAADRRTQTGAKLGTVQYMAPEQVVDASRVDARADIYSLGVTLFELFTGRPPFDSENLYTLMQMHREAEVPKPTDLRSDLAPAIETVILKALSKDPDDRFQSCGEMAEALKRVDPEAPPPLPPIALGLGVGGPVDAETEPPPMPGASPPASSSGAHPGAPAEIDALGSTAPAGLPRIPSGRFATAAGTDDLELELERPARRSAVTYSRAAVMSGGQPTVSTAERAIPMRHRRSLDRWIRVAFVLTLALVVYQATPTLHCLWEVTDAHRIGSDNRAEFNPGGYTRLDPESARAVAGADGFSDALAVGAPICWQRAGFGRGHHIIFGFLLALSFVATVALFAAERLGRARAMPEEPSQQPARPRPKRPSHAPISMMPEDVDTSRVRLTLLEGQSELPRGRDLYLTLKAEGLRRSDLPSLRVKAAIRCTDGELVLVWPSPRPIARLLSGVPTAAGFSSLPFIIPFDDVRRALDRSERPVISASAILVRVERGGQKVAHVVHFNP